MRVVEVLGLAPVNRQHRYSRMHSATIVLDFRILGAWDRGIVRSISEFGREHDWNIVLSSSGVTLAEVAESWSASVVVTSSHVSGPQPGRLGEALIIVVGHDESANGFPSISPDDAAVGQLAAKHLLQTGLKNTACFAYDGSPFARERSAAFRAEITAAGGVCHPGGEFSNSLDAPNFCSHQSILTWLKGLPKPCGVFAPCDNWASPISMYCRLLGLRIPEDVALLGVDNDTLVCELSSPPLSSVAIPWGEMGRRIGGMIADYFAGRPVPRECVRVQPIDVVSRRSTDTLSIDNEQVAQAVLWIRRNAHRMISVDDIVRAVPTYRQRLERQFRAGLGRTVMEEVRTAHIELAKTLLISTDLPMPEIAVRSGFSNATLLGVNFRRELGITPSEYRRRAQSDGASHRRSPVVSGPLGVT